MGKGFSASVTYSTYNNDVSAPPPVAYPENKYIKPLPLPLSMSITKIPFTHRIQLLQRRLHLRAAQEARGPEFVVGDIVCSEGWTVYQGLAYFKVRSRKVFREICGRRFCTLFLEKKFGTGRTPQYFFLRARILGIWLSLSGMWTADRCMPAGYVRRV